MRAIRVSVAESKKELLANLRMRCKSFKEREGYPIMGGDREVTMEMDPYDALDRTRHFNAYEGGKMIGASRIVLPIAEATGERYGLPHERKFTVCPSRPGLRGRRGEVGRVCVDRSYQNRKVHSRVCHTMCEVSLREDVSVWVSSANLDTDSEEEADIMYKLLDQRGSIHHDIETVIKTSERPSGHPRFLFFRDCHERTRARLGKASRLPRAVSADERVGVMFIGSPYWEPELGTFVQPLIAEVRHVLANLTGSRRKNS